MLSLGRVAARKLALHVPPIARLAADRDRWRERANALSADMGHERRSRAALEEEIAALRRDVGHSAAVRQAFPPGHYYSPIPDLDEVSARDAEIFNRARREVPGINIGAMEQLALLPRFAAFYAEQPFSEEPVDELRYAFNNRFFSYGDGLVFYAMLRHIKPRRLIEVGSGWSSALALDVNERFLGGAMECTFLEPYPERLRQLLRPADRQHVTVVEQRLHTVPDTVFAELEAGDLLFVDSTHVSRVGSDVNRLFLEVLPDLPAGVYVHVHDVFWPFEYPRDWVYQGRAWNEAYLLRALLINNERVCVLWFNDYLRQFHADEVAGAMPLWRRNPGGSIYLRTC